MSNRSSCQCINISIEPLQCKQNDDASQAFCYLGDKTPKQKNLVTRSKHTSFMLFSLDLIGYRSQWGLAFRLPCGHRPCSLSLCRLLVAPRVLVRPSVFGQGLRKGIAPLPSAPVLSFATGPPARRLRLWLASLRRSQRGGSFVFAPLTLHSRPFRPPAFARLCCAVSCRRLPSRHALPAPQTLTTADLHDVTQLRQSSTRVLRTNVSLISVIIHQIHSDNFHI